MREHVLLQKYFANIILCALFLFVTGFVSASHAALAAKNTLNFDSVSKLSKSAQSVKLPSSSSKFTSKLAGSMQHKFSYIPRVYLTGAGGYDGWTGLGQGDVLFPLLSRYDRDIFIYGQGRYSYDGASWANNPWTGSIGVGYRQIIANSMVFGAYILGSDTKTNTKHSIYMASPGIELLGKVWEFRLNGYLPFKNTDWDTEGWASDFGDYSHVSFKWHNEYDAKFIFHEETGVGADTDIGRTLFSWDHLLVKGFLDGYYFSMKHNTSVYGGGARLTFEPTNYLKFSVADTYDNHRKNVAMAALQLSIYDLFSSSSSRPDPNDLEHKLYAPLERNFANIGSGSDARTTGGPDDKALTSPEVVYPSAPKHSNVWFFYGGNNNVTAAMNSSSDAANTDTPDGTYEHPYSAADFDQAKLDYIHKQGNNAIIYLSSGSYNAYTHFLPLQLYSDMVLQGRMGAEHGFQEPATGAQRPVLNGALKVSSNDAVENLVLNSDVASTCQETGLTLDNAQNVLLSDVSLGSNDTDNGYQTAISMLGTSSLTLDNSKIYAYNELHGLEAVGIKTQGNSSVDALNHSTVSAINQDGTAYGIKAGDADNSVVTSLNINGDATTTFSGTGTENGYGLFINSPTVTMAGINRVNFTGTGNNSSSGYGAYIVANNLAINNIAATNFTGNGDQNGYGLYFVGASSIANIGKISGVNFIGTGKQSTGVGLYLDAKSVALGDISNSKLQGTGSNLGVGALINNDLSAKPTIASIYNTVFKGIASGAQSSGYGLYSSGNSNDLIIGDIADSTFTGNGNANGAGLYLNTQGGNLTLGNISGTGFAGTGSDLGYGLYGEGLTNVKIGDISNSSSFTGNGAQGMGVGLVVSGDNSVTFGSIADSVFKGTGLTKGDGADINIGGMVNTVIGNISNSIFKGDVTGSDNSSCGLYVGGNSGDINIGDISGSTFSGIGKSGGYGFDLQNNNKGLNIGDTTYFGNITIGNISNSTFSGTGAADGYGFYLINNNTGGLSTSDVNDTTEIYGNIKIGDISGSTFTGTGASNGDGFAVTDNNKGSSSISAVNETTYISGNIDIGNISGSTFTGNSSDNGYGFYTHGEGNVTVGDLSADNFSGVGDSIGAGFYIKTADSQASTNDSFKIQVGSISAGSKFTGTKLKAQGPGTGAYGMFLANNNGEIAVGNIESANFSASAPDFAYAFVAEGTGSVSVGNISNSKFLVNKALQSDGMVFASGGDVSIGNISGSSFGGEGFLLSENDSYALDLDVAKNITIGTVTNSTFWGGTDSAINIRSNKADEATIAGFTIKPGDTSSFSNIYNALIGNGNQFGAGSQYNIYMLFNGTSLH